MHCFTLTNKSHKSSTGMSDFDESPTKRKKNLKKFYFYEDIQ